MNAVIRLGAAGDLYVDIHAVHVVTHVLVAANQNWPVERSILGFH